MSQAIAACVVALKTFAWPDLSHWRGLPDCDLAAVEQALTVPRDMTRASGYLGEQHHERMWMSATGAGLPGSIRIWLDGDHVLVLEAEIRGRPADFKALVAKLGPPAAKLDSHLRNVLMPKSEWVY